MKLPEPDERVGVLIDSTNKHLSSRVEDVQKPDLLVIAAPSDGRSDVAVEKGELLTILWTCGRGLVEGVGEVVGIEGSPAQLVSVRLASSRVAQRRDHVRVEMVLDVVIRQTAAVPVECHTLDLSGGGMRAVIPRDLASGEVVEALLTLPGEGELEVDAEVLRGSAATSYALRFVGLDADDTERLIRFVFAAHRHEFTYVRGPER